MGDLIMPQFILQIKLGNSAMKSNFDLGSKLMGIGNQITYGSKEILTSGEKTLIKDLNGNTVGFYQVTGKPGKIIEVD